MSRLESEDGNDVDNDADANSDEPVTTLARLAATLRSWRYAVYVGGLVVVTLGARVGPEWARTPLVVLTLTVIGLVALIVPGVFVAISFFFVRQEIAVRDVNFVDAMAGSWALTSGHRVELFGLAVVVFFAGLAAAIPGFIVGFASPAAGTALNAIARAVVLTFGVASAARAYDQLRDTAADESSDEPRYEGALSADDLPSPTDEAE